MTKHSTYIPYIPNKLPLFIQQTFKHLPCSGTVLDSFPPYAFSKYVSCLTFFKGDEKIMQLSQRSSYGFLVFISSEISISLFSPMEISVSVQLKV